MKFLTQIFFIILLTGHVCFAQNINPVWHLVPASEQAFRAEKSAKGIPETSEIYAFDFVSLQAQLFELSNNNRSAGTIVLPIEGKMEVFEVISSPIMEPGLQARFHEFKSFRAKSMNHPGMQARVGITPMGFHGIVTIGHDDILIEPLTQGDQKYCAFFKLSDGLKEADFMNTFVCGTEHGIEEGDEHDANEIMQLTVRNQEKRMRHFKVGIACTSSFARDVGSTETAVMNKIYTVMNQVNMRYNLDLGMQFDIIDKTPTLWNLDPEQDFFNIQNNGTQLLGLSQQFFQQKLTPSEYDFGQTWTTSCTDVGGVVSGNACNLNGKARGVSCGPNNVGYFLTTVKHEMGHQFTGSHTFSSCNGSTQLASQGAYEPGSGSTILSYAGGCGPDNITGTASDYFHIINIIQMETYIASVPTCGTHGDEINHTPVPTLPTYHTDVPTIPANTPYEMIGFATDSDGDELVYNWEQFDAGIGEPLGTNTTFGPLSRSYPPHATRNYRCVPQLPNILTGNFDVADRLPTVTREMNWKFNVRDQNLKAGSTVFADFKFKVDGDSGPFGFSFPSLDVDTFFTLGQYVELTWDVANTNKAPVNAEFVDIFFSTDGGNTFPDTLVVRTPNDGRELVMIPRVGLNTRYKVKGHGNIFFNITQKSVRVSEPVNAGYSFDLFPHNALLCPANVTDFELKSFGWKNFDQPITLELVDGWPTGTDIKLNKSTIMPGETATITIDTREVTEAGWYRIRVKGEAEGTEPQYRFIDVEILASSLEFVGAVEPTSGQSGVTQVPSFEWSPISGADYYEFEVSTSPKFESHTIVDTYVGPNINFKTEKVYEPGKIFYWRVRATNRCYAGPWSDLNTFQTELYKCNLISALNLPRPISSNISVPPVEVNFSIANAVGTVGDVNITGLNLDHADISRLELYVKSPSGKQVLLFGDKCFGRSDMRTSFDDQSPLNLDCGRIRNNVTFKPLESMSVFNGENVSGNWTLIIKTVVGGAIGQLNNVNMDLCATVQGSQIDKINNEVINVKKGTTQVVDNSQLLYVSNQSPEIQYTLLSQPKHGSISVWGAPVNKGEFFYQSGVNSWAMNYTPNDPNFEGDDEVWVALHDDQYGFRSPELIRFNVNEAHSVNTKDNQGGVQKLICFPNPSNGMVNIVLPETMTDESLKLVVRNLQGNILTTQQINSTSKMVTTDLANFASGVYIIEIVSQHQTAVSRVVKQ